MKYEGVIFDLDGTLLNTIEDLADSMNHVLKSNGYLEHETEKYKYLVGKGMEALVRLALPDGADEDKVRKCLADMKAEYEKRCLNKTRPYEGIYKLLDALASKGVKMSVLSNKPDKFTKMTIEHYFGKERFSCIFGAREDMPKKPDPRAALKISELTQIPPESYVYVGDSGVDMITASAAGMFAVGAAWGFRTKDELLKNGAQDMINKPLDLLKFFK